MCEGCRTCSSCDDADTDYYDDAGCWLCRPCAIEEGLVDAVTALAEVAPEGWGDCFEHAGRWAADHPTSTAIICHGHPLGQGPIEGIRHAHAWIETEHPLLGWLVHDRSNGKSIEDMPAALYYSAGRIDPARVRRYTVAEARSEMARTRHFGPWVEQSEEAI